MSVFEALTVMITFSSLIVSIIAVVVAIIHQKK
ncbi:MULTISPECIES: putative holin-like toxin [Halobacillus]